MRSIVLTFLLALLSLLVCGLVGWRLSQGNLDVLFGAPPTRTGDLLYPGFKATEVRKIALFTKASSISEDGNVNDNTSDKGTRAVFLWDPKKGWMMEEPWKDRMDPRAAQALIEFTRGTRVADVIPKDKIDPAQAGFKGGVIVVRMEDASGQPMCKYLLGRKTAWIGTEEVEQQPGQMPEPAREVPTVFVRTWDKSRKNYVYACTGDIHPLFNDGFRYLRDHHPFLFAPQFLQHVRIRTSTGELTLARETPNHPWRIIKPLDLPTDPERMHALLLGLERLRAVKVSDRSAVTVPTNGAATGSDQIAIQMFGAPAETILDILPQQTPEATTRLATVSDRPGTVFELPAKAETDFVTLSSLPLQVNQLRDSTLTNLDVASIAGILIQPANRPAISLIRQPRQWMLGDGPDAIPANERRLYDLLVAVKDAKTIGFVTDAATDFSQWGLDNPLISIRFLAANNQSLELAFGRDKAGNYFVNRRGTTSVMKVGGDILSKIATRPFEWRGGLVWSLPKVDIKWLEIQPKGQPLIHLNYDDINEKFEPFRGGLKAESHFEPARAGILIEALGALEANRWLAEDDEAALNALATPTLTFAINSRQVNDSGEETGEQKRVLQIAPASSGTANRFYYARVNSDPNPFIIDQETYIRLSVDLFAGDR
ncbi:DUF4340 domain-containing protein [Luteolibacter sp. LG18]|uniref:DUF4340 domain-containing protein n=1 Tax=Luteolibacter sp. LG18 TaxID=2819286 RepID=UPI002B283364|nr:hypothetical protein llg_01360 [Luteolibacter sp. LG18]